MKPITFSSDRRAVDLDGAAAEARRVVELVAVEPGRARQEGADEAADQERPEDVSERQLDALAAQQDRPAIHRGQDADELDAGRERAEGPEGAVVDAGERVERPAGRPPPVEPSSSFTGCASSSQKTRTVSQSLEGVQQRARATAAARAAAPPARAPRRRGFRAAGTRELRATVSGRRGAAARGAVIRMEARVRSASCTEVAGAGASLAGGRVRPQDALAQHVVLRLRDLARASSAPRDRRACAACRARDSPAARPSRSAGRARPRGSPSGPRAARPCRSAGCACASGAGRSDRARRTATACGPTSVMPSDATTRNFITCSSTSGSGSSVFSVVRDLPVRARRGRCRAGRRSRRRPGS